LKVHSFGWTPIGRSFDDEIVDLADRKRKLTYYFSRTGGWHGSRIAVCAEIGDLLYLHFGIFLLIGK
jgi:hypothetical protein